MAAVCRFRFSEQLEKDVIETQLALALVAAECTFGQPKVRINAAYYIADDKRQAAIDVSTTVGEFIAQLFTGLIIRQLGEENFTVERVEGKDKEVTA